MNKIIIFLCLLAFNCFASIPEPYSYIEDLPFDGHGWFMNADSLEKIIKTRSVKTVIEVGSWLGSSTRFIASCLDEGGKVYAVDTWLGSPNEPVHMQDPRLPYLYQLFLSNVKHCGLCEKITPVRMKSLEAAKALNVKCDLIYIDAGHDTESVMLDILTWIHHLNENGVMCGDDWGWASVQKGVMQAASALNKQVAAEGNFWYFID